MSKKYFLGFAKIMPSLLIIYLSYISFTQEIKSLQQQALIF